VSRALRRQRLVRTVHELGARVTFELLDELARAHGIGDDIDERLAGYASLRPEILRALGADQFPATPLHLVTGDG
jgi:hypothetical protein